MKIETHPVDAAVRSDVKSWGTSIGVHLLLLMMMAFWVLPALVDSTRHVLDVRLGSSGMNDPLLSLDLPSDELMEGVIDPSSEAPVSVNVLPIMTSFSPMPSDLSSTTDITPDSFSNLTKQGGSPSLELLEKEDRVNSSIGMRRPSTTAEIRSAQDAADAVAAVTGAIEREMEQGNTLIVWLLDASISLVDNRALVSERMEEFYKRTRTFQTRKEKYEGKHLLLNAVVAYGKGSKELLGANRFGARVCEALQKVPPDTTGDENVMAAIQKAVHFYREVQRRRERMLFVVITDESGDDTLLLEPTIGLCREAGIAVHVVGPSAVFGAQRGSHLWTARASDGSRGQFLLPVNRGPDTALPERAFLPYWHESVLPPWRQGGVVSANGVPWYGGAYRERLLSGVGPYALTRLALMTGGSFTILDRNGDEGPFTLEAMRDYLPSYESASRYDAKLRQSPLRSAVSDVSILTHEHIAAFVPPRMAFMANRGAEYPFSVRFGYFHPSAFRAILKRTLIKERRRLEETQQTLAVALQMFANPEVNWEYEYAKEPSARWRAWYDLTKGRLLALQVRRIEYEAACNETQTNLDPRTNKVIFHPWKDHLRLSESASVADEAKRLLVRCSTRNPETPWKALADWELAIGFGIRVEQGVVPPPPPPRPSTGIPGVARGKAPTFSFPNL